MAKIVEWERISSEAARCHSDLCHACKQVVQRMDGLKILPSPLTCG